MLAPLAVKVALSPAQSILDDITVETDGNDITDTVEIPGAEEIHPKVSVPVTE